METLNKNNKFELDFDKLYNLITEAYRHGFIAYEKVDAGLESYDADGYARWILLKMKKNND